jgi:Arc/MetJ-type ribon-helix-helix transcriptional regulator
MSSKSDDTSDSDWRTREHRERDIAQARALKDQARQGGLRFEVFLPPDLAGWILDLVERGVFIDPSEAVFVKLGEQRELEPHADLRREILKRSLRASVDDPTPLLSMEELNARMRVRAEGPRIEPAEWIRSKPDRSKRRVIRSGELPDDVVEAIRNTKMDPRHDHLNAMLDDPTGKG